MTVLPVEVAVVEATMVPAEVGMAVTVHLHMQYPAQPTVPVPEPLEETVLEEVAVTVLETVTEITEETQILRQLSNRSIPYIPQDIYNWISK